MSINKEEYIESMRRLEFSDETKGKMIGNLTKISTPGNGGVMKKGIKVGKAVIIAAACVMIFGVTAAAAGIASVVVSHNRLGSRTDDFTSKIYELARSKRATACSTALQMNRSIQFSVR